MKKENYFKPHTEQKPAVLEQALSTTKKWNPEHLWDINLMLFKI